MIERNLLTTVLIFFYFLVLEILLKTYFDVKNLNAKLGFDSDPVQTWLLKILGYALRVSTNAEGRSLPISELVN